MKPILAAIALAIIAASILVAAVLLMPAARPQEMVTTLACLE